MKADFFRMFSLTTRSVPEVVCEAYVSENSQQIKHYNIKNKNDCG